MDANSSKRITAILLKDKVEEVFQALAPLRIVSCEWDVSGLDEDLPADNEVKAVFDAFVGLEIPALNVRSALSAIAAADDSDYILPPAPACGASGTGLFDGSVLMDGSTDFKG